jgi:NADH dehydrogenase
VFAIGDCARLIPEGQTLPLPGVAQVAIQEGRHVARNIVRDLQSKPLEPFRYRDKGMMATIGRSRAVAQSGKLKLSGWLAWMAWLFVHIWFLMGVRNRIAVVFNWFWAYVTYRRGARLITGWRSWDWNDRESAMAAQYEQQEAPARLAAPGAPVEVPAERVDGSKDGRPRGALTPSPAE